MKDLFEKLLSGDRLALARSMTLLESELSEDQKKADDLLSLLPGGDVSKTFRLGVSGVPGVGKSSLIELVGLRFIEAGYKVAVLAIDPSSEISKGSILGDKTRMEELSKREESFIRPSASRGYLGGVATATRDNITLCEAAGYDVVIIETVGVGQSESLVSDLVDCFVFMGLPGAGDELQGIKKGVLEKADIVVVNKCDGDNKIAAEVAEKQYTSALKILRSTDVPVYKTSAVTGDGVDSLLSFFKSIWVEDLDKKLLRRKTQEEIWVPHYVDNFIKSYSHREMARPDIISLAETVRGGVSARSVAREIVEQILPSNT